jgi:hypothetical protein
MNNLINFPFQEKVIVLDSQWQDAASKNKTKFLLDAGLSVFIWPKNLGLKYKDFNAIAVGQKMNKIPATFVDEHSYNGLKGRVILSQIN